MRSNQEKIIGDVISILPSLTRGLDVNVKFRHIKDFEFTPECAVFDVVDIDLVHGWLVDPQNKELAKVIGDKSYNQLVELAISMQTPVSKRKTSIGDPRDDSARHAQMVRAFLNRTQSQMTYHGLMEMYANVKERQLCVLFRNNHFSVLFKNDSKLYTLMTDAGYLDVPDLVWEELAEIDGDSNFCNADFCPVTMADTESDSWEDDINPARDPRTWDYMDPVSVKYAGEFMRGVFLHRIDQWSVGVGLLKDTARPPYGDNDYQYREVHQSDVISREIVTPVGLPEAMVLGVPVGQATTHTLV